jgi:ribosome-associated translation inhibitor RaiA
MIDAFSSVKPMQSDVASMIELPGRMKGEVCKWHMDATDSIRQRIGKLQIKSKHKVTAIAEYIELMQKLDVQISMVTNNQESSGYVEGTIRVLSDAIQQYNDKYALYCDFDQRCCDVEANIEKAKRDMKDMLNNAKKIEADDAHRLILQRYQHEQSDNCQIL